MRESVRVRERGKTDRYELLLMNLACGYWLNAILQPLFPHELKSNLLVRNFARVLSSIFSANAFDDCLKWSFISFMKLPKNLASRSTGAKKAKKTK